MRDANIEKLPVLQSAEAKPGSVRHEKPPRNNALKVAKDSVTTGDPRDTLREIAQNDQPDKLSAAENPDDDLYKRFKKAADKFSDNPENPDLAGEKQFFEALDPDRVQQLNQRYYDEKNNIPGNPQAELTSIPPETIKAERGKIDRMLAGLEENVISGREKRGADYHVEGLPDDIVISTYGIEPPDYSSQQTSFTMIAKTNDGVVTGYYVIGAGFNQDKGFLQVNGTMLVDASRRNQRVGSSLHRVAVDLCQRLSDASKLKVQIGADNQNIEYGRQFEQRRWQSIFNRGSGPTLSPNNAGADKVLSSELVNLNKDGSRNSGPLTSASPDISKEIKDIHSQTQKAYDIR